MSADTIVLIEGDEPFLVDRALAGVEAAALGTGDPGLNRQVFEAAGVKAADVVGAARTLPFLAPRRLVIVREVEAWSADEWKPFLPYLERPSPSTCLVFVATRLDRRLASSKALLRAARTVECPRPRDREVGGWARRLAAEAGLRLDPRVTEALAARVGADLQLLSREIEKLRVFAVDGDRVSLEDVERLVGETRGTTVFALCDALGTRSGGEALRSLRRLVQLGEPAPRLLHMIVRHFRHLWIGRDLMDRGGRPGGREAAAAMGVPPFAAENALRQARDWPADDLRELFRRLVAADAALKSGGGFEVLEGLVLYVAAGRETKAPRPTPGRSKPPRGSSSRP